MPAFTVLIHTSNDALRLGRALETLYPCDEILVIDHGSHDHTVQIARESGARVTAAENDAPANHYAQIARNEWILCLDPRESLTEGLAASLYEWRALPTETVIAVSFSVCLREETANGWFDSLTPQTRLVRRSWDRWHGWFPIHDPAARVLEGQLLRFSFP